MSSEQAPILQSLYCPCCELRVRQILGSVLQFSGVHKQLNQSISQSFRQLNVQQLSDSALAQYETLLGKMIALAKAEPHAVLDPPKG